MKWSAVLVGLALALSACEGSSRQVSAAQRFDSLRLGLRAVTVQSEQVGADVRRLESDMRAGRVERARAAAVKLKVDSLSFARAAGRQGNIVRRLERGEVNVHLHEYLRLVVQTLSLQWQEGRALGRLGDVVWADPLVSRGSSDQLFRDLAARARRSAYVAAGRAAQAARYRRRFPASFRYTVTTHP